MVRLLTPFVMFHWAALFSLLASLCLLGGTDGLTQMFHFVGLAVESGPVASATGASAATVLSVALSLCAVLFWWGLLAALWGEPDGNKVLDLAFACACATLTLIMFYAAVQRVQGLFPVIATNFCALLVSYIAVSLSGNLHPHPASDDDARSLAGLRERVVEASHAASLARYSARPSLVGSD